MISISLTQLPHSEANGNLPLSPATSEQWQMKLCLLFCCLDQWWALCTASPAASAPGLQPGWLTTRVWRSPMKGCSSGLPPGEVFVSRALCLLWRGLQPQTQHSAAWQGPHPPWPTCPAFLATRSHKRFMYPLPSDIKSLLCWWVDCSPNSWMAIYFSVWCDVDIRYAGASEDDICLMTVNNFRKPTHRLLDIQNQLFGLLCLGCTFFLWDCLWAHLLLTLAFTRQPQTPSPQNGSITSASFAVSLVLLRFLPLLG